MSTEELPLKYIASAAFSRSFGNFQDEKLARRTAIAVAAEFSVQWQQKLSAQSQQGGGYLLKLNTSYYLDQLISSHNQRIKDAYLKDWNRRKALTAEDLWIWFLEDLLDFAKKHRPTYMAVSILKVLCDYTNAEIYEIYGEIDTGRYTTGDDSIFRRLKVDNILPYMNKRYAPFTEVKEAGKGEKRYVKESNIDDYLQMFELWLKQLSPLIPPCPDPDHFRDLDVLEKQYINYNVTGSPDSAERKRIHIMQCPECLTKLLNAAKFRNWSNSFSVPKMTLAVSKSRGSGPKSDRTKPKELDQGTIDLMQTLLDKNDMRRQRLSLRSLFVAVDNDKPRKLSLNQTFRIHIEEGSSVIRISGKDWRGMLPLDTHFILWDSQLLDQQPIRYITKLRDGRTLECLLTYEFDEFAEPRGAAIDISYIREVPHRSLIPRLSYLKSISDFFRLADGITAAMSIAALGATIFILKNYGLLVILLSMILALGAFALRWSASIPTSKRRRNIFSLLGSATVTLLAVLSTPPFHVLHSKTLRGIGPSINAYAIEIVSPLIRVLNNEEEGEQIATDYSSTLTTTVKRISAKRVHSRTVKRTYINSNTGSMLHRNNVLNAKQVKFRGNNLTISSTYHSRQSKPFARALSTTSHISRRVGAPANLSSVMGIVTDINNIGISGVKIAFRDLKLDTENFAVISDATGRFRLCSMNAGVYNLTVEKKGFVPLKEANFSIHKNRRNQIDIKLDSAQSSKYSATATITQPLYVEEK